MWPCAEAWIIPSAGYLRTSLLPMKLIWPTISTLSLSLSAKLTRVGTWSSPPGMDQRAKLKAGLSTANLIILSPIRFLPAGSPESTKLKTITALSVRSGSKVFLIRLTGTRLPFVVSLFLIIGLTCLPPSPPRSISCRLFTDSAPGANPKSVLIPNTSVLTSGMFLSIFFYVLKSGDCCYGPH